MTYDNDLLDGRFQLLDTGNRGGMGVVYRAHDRLRDQIVALKVHEAESSSPGPLLSLSGSLRNEAQILSRIEHPNAVSSVAHGVAGDGRHYLAMEWLSGIDLQERLHRGPLLESQVIALGVGLCRVIDFMHRRAVVHRDIKPANIILIAGDPGQPRLIDFGLAAIHDPASGPVSPGQLSASSNAADLIVGTPGYLAPEHASGESLCDPRSDIYSLGATLFACLTQQPPYRGINRMAVLAKTIFEQAPPVSEFNPQVTSELEQLIARLLDKDVQRRPASAAQVATLLQNIQQRRSMPARRARVAISSIEQRVFSVLVIEPQKLRVTPQLRTQLQDWAAECGAVLQILLDGTIMAVFSASDEPSEMVTTAAQFALRVRHTYQEATMAIATGRGLWTHGMPVGPVIDRAAMLMFGNAETVAVAQVESEQRPSVVVDESTARLLLGHFRLRPYHETSYALEAARAESTLQDCADIVLVGREQELQTLDMHYRQCVTTGRAESTVLLGAGGIGKTALVQELVAAVRGEPAPPTVWMAVGDPSHTHTPFGVVRQLLRNVLGLASDTSPDECRAVLAQRLPDIVPEDRLEQCRVFLCELMDAPLPEVGRIWLQEARRDRRLMHDQIGRAWHDFLHAVSRRGPMLMVIDDLHFCDSPSLYLLRSALRALSARPVWIVGLARPVVLERFPRLFAIRAVRRLDLQPLSPSACEQLARHHALDPDDGFIADVVARADGNPLYLELLVQARAEDRNSELEDTLLAVFEARLRALTSEQRQVLRAGSVLGRRFWPAVLRRLLELSRERIDDVLRELLERGLLVCDSSRNSARGAEYRFVHDQTREAAYAMLPPSERERAHACAGLWLAQQAGVEPVVVANHYVAALASKRARLWLLRAAVRALTANNTKDAVAYAAQAIDSGATGPLLGCLQLVQAESCNWQGDHEPALQHAREALQQLPPSSADWANAAHHLIWAAGELARFEELERGIISLEAYLQVQPRVEHAIALAWCPAHLTAGGRNRLAAEILLSLERMRPAMNAAPALDAVLAHSRATVALVSGWNDRSAVCFSEASRHWETVGNQRNACLDGLNAAESLLMLGQYEVAESLLRHHLELSERLQVDFLVHGARNFLAVGLLATGAHDEAESLLRQLTGNREEDHQRCLWMTNEARLLLARGRPDASLERVEQALRALGDFPHTRALALAIQAQALLELCAPMDALRAVEKGMALLSELGFIEDGDAFLRLVHARVLRAVGRPRQAASAIAKAQSCLLSRADLIENREWRSSFLTRVEENRATLTWANSGTERPELVRTDHTAGAGQLQGR